MTDTDNCPRIYPLHLLSRKWSYFILKTLQKKLHFSEILKELHPITNRVLSHELSLLEEEGVILHSKEYYVISELGTSLLEALEPLAKWSVKHKQLKYCPLEQECSHCARFKEMMQDHEEE